MNISQITSNPQCQKPLLIAKIILISFLLFLVLMFANQVGLSTLNKKFFSHTYPQSSVLSYYFHPQNGDYTLLIGDLNCLNPEGALLVAKKAKSQPVPENAVIFFPGLCSDTTELAQETEINDFSQRIGNANGVVMIDNFCTKNWQALINKPLYTDSVLTPGPYCGSENEVVLLDKIIRNYGVKKVILTYNVESYKSFSKNFLDYLVERNIAYEFKHNNDL